MDNRPIGFFDSGVGGLSILTEVSQLLPHERLVYIADSAHFPYGALSPERLCALAAGLTRFLLAQDAKLIVVACNTATVHALGYLRDTFPGTPFVGVVPVVKTLAEQSRSGVIGLLSTPSTAQSPYLTALIEQFARGMRVINVPCDGLADLVEAGDLSDPRIKTLLRACLGPIVAGGADVVGLGCTHYPFLRSRIEVLLGERARVFDSSAPVAQRVRVVLADAGPIGNEANPNHHFFTTGDPTRFAAVVKSLVDSPADILARTTIGTCTPSFD